MVGDLHVLKRSLDSGCFGIAGREAQVVKGVASGICLRCVTDGDLFSLLISAGGLARCPAFV